MFVMLAGIRTIYEKAKLEDNNMQMVVQVVVERRRVKNVAAAVESASGLFCC